MELRDGVAGTSKRCMPAMLSTDTSELRMANGRGGVQCSTHSFEPSTQACKMFEEQDTSKKCHMIPSNADRQAGRRSGAPPKSCAARRPPPTARLGVQVDTQDVGHDGHEDKVQEANVVGGGAAAAPGARL